MTRRKRQNIRFVSFLSKIRKSINCLSKKSRLDVIQPFKLNTVKIAFNKIFH